MKVISVILVLFLFGCSPEETANCNCGTIIKVEDVSSSQWKYTVKNDCDGSIRTYESRKEILGVGQGKCN